MRTALITVLQAEDRQAAKAIAARYVDCIADPAGAANIQLLVATIDSTSDKIFGLFLKKFPDMDPRIREESNIGFVLENFISQERIDGYFASGRSIDWLKLCDSLTKEYPTLGHSLVERADDRVVANVISMIRKVSNRPDSIIDWRTVLKVVRSKLLQYPDPKIRQMVEEEEFKCYGNRKMWPQYDRAVLAYMEKYDYPLTHWEKNNIAWYVFIHSNNKDALRAAARWCRQIIEQNPQDAESIDTYANLLLKQGLTEKAIYWEERAFEVGDDAVKKEATANLEKMRRGDKTWTD